MVKWVGLRSFRSEESLDRGDKVREISMALLESTLSGSVHKLEVNLIALVSRH